MRTESQNYIIWEYLKEHGEINDDTCRQIGGGKRLAARVWDLRHLYGKEILAKDVYKLNARGKKYQDRVYYLEA